MANRPPLPMSRAILLANTIITDNATHKRSLIGIYSHVVAPRLPFRKALNVYAQITDAMGEYTFTIELMRLATGEVVHEGSIGPINAPDRLQPLELVIKVPCEFKAFGEYEFRLLHAGHVFASCVIPVMPPVGAALPEPPGSNQSSPENGESDC